MFSFSMAALYLYSQKPAAAFDLTKREEET